MIVVIGLPAYSDEADGEICAGGLAVEIAAEARRRGAEVELAGKLGGDGAGDAVVVALGRLGVGHAALLRDPARPTPLLVSQDAELLDSVTGTGVGSATKGDETAPFPGRGAAETDQSESTDQPSRLLPEDPIGRPGLEAGDIEMALRYLANPRVVVVAEPLTGPALSAAVDGAAFAGANLIVLTTAGSAANRGAAGAAPNLPDLPEEATLLQMPLDDDGSFARLVGAYAASLDAGVEPAAAFRDGVSAAGWEPSAE